MSSGQWYYQSDSYLLEQVFSWEDKPVNHGLGIGPQSLRLDLSQVVWLELPRALPEWQVVAVIIHGAPAEWSQIMTSVLALASIYDS